MHSDFPKPDRSSYVPNFMKSAENDQVDIGWAEGTLRDGRPYRLELWAQDQCTCATAFLSVRGLEDASSGLLLHLLERDSVIVWINGTTPSGDAAVFVDSAGHQLWSMNVVVGLDDEPARVWTIPVQSYNRD